MTNKDIARTFNALARIMELHNENPYKIRSYSNAYIQLRKLDRPLSEMTEAEINEIKGVGKAISGKIMELLANGTMATYEKYREQTPEGIQELLEVKGLGPKKLRQLWKEMGIESVGELLYACNENRLIELKGFGYKTQETLRQQLTYFQQSRGKSLYARVEGLAEELEAYVKSGFPEAEVSLVGAFRRRHPVIESIDILVGTDEKLDVLFGEKLVLQQQNDMTYEATTPEDIKVRIFQCDPKAFGSKLFRYTGSAEFIQAFLKRSEADDFRGLQTEKAIFDKASLPYLAPELRETDYFLEQAEAGKVPELLEVEDVKGIIHAHTTYSDGLHSLREMAEYVKAQGFAYLGITDHSQSAFYANGLKPDRVRQQWAEIDALNVELAPFKIFKGIESDILNDGRLDYEDELLEQFDFIIASVHAHLKMDEEKATRRLLTAIENPHTTILGHPTGRLLLSRQGYPIDHMKVIDACAAHGVSIELNANPYRLDLDWSWIPYALEKGVKICINPDAHSREGIHDIKYGVLAARKGGMTAGDLFSL